MPAQSNAPLLTYEYRLLRGEGSDYRRIQRSSIFYGPTDVRVTTVAPYQISAITIVDEGRVQLSGKREVLCRSSASSNECEVDFGKDIARHTLRIETEIRDENGGRPTTISQSFRTLDAHPAGEASFLAKNVMVEHTQARALPPDEVMRLVRVERKGSKGEGERMTYRDDLTQDSFLVKVQGIRDVKVLSVRPPDPTQRKLIPILFNVSNYLTERTFGRPKFGWHDHYEDMVFTLVQGLRTAALRGVDVEYVLVPYAVTGRVFGPFRLHTGTSLDESQRRSNDETLHTLEQFLTETPLSQWQERARGHWVDDFAGMVHTLNDLCLRSYDGLVQGVWITGGWVNPSGSRPRFQDDMWPERLAELNLEWSDTEFLQFVERLDAGGSVHNEEVLQFVELLEEYSPHAHSRITTFLRELNPGATDTLHPHRVDSSPMLNVLLVPSDRALRADRMGEFRTFVSQQYGADVFRLLELDRNRIDPRGEELQESDHVAGAESVAQVLERTYEQLVHSYVIRLEVPNPKQNGARRDLNFEIVEPGTNEKAARFRRYEVAYMPYYTSSRSVRARLADYLRSPFKELRLLSAYELRNHWSDDELYAVRADQWRVERDGQVRSMLFETWVSVNLKRLQAYVQRKRLKLAEDAFLKLQLAGENAEKLPDPLLARDAALLAEWYRADRELFGRAGAAPN
jgi:hypothetical protein